MEIDIRALILYIFVFISLLVTVALVHADPIMEASSTISATISGTSNPSETASNGLSGRTSGGSGFTCNDKLWIDKPYCRDNLCPKYIKLNNCSEEPAAKHLCCLTYWKPEVKESNESTVPINIEVKQPEEKKDEIGHYDWGTNILANVLSGIIIAACIGLFVMMIAKKRKIPKKLKSVKEEQSMFLCPHCKECRWNKMVICTKGSRYGKGIDYAKKGDQIYCWSCKKYFKR